jgi:hypothetical protein
MSSDSTIGADAPTNIDINVLHVRDCPNASSAVQRARVAAQLAGPASIRMTEVIDEHEARELHMHGSPTILVDGHDAFSDPAAPTGLGCRVRPGQDPVPSVEEIRAALAERRIR